MAKRTMSLPVLRLRLKVLAAKQAKLRDEMRDLQDDAEEFLGANERAAESLESAIEALSELV